MSETGRPDGASGANGSTESFRELLAAALDAHETSGPAGFDAFCEAHPDHAPRLRDRFTILRNLGLMPDAAARAREPGTPERIGSYRILRRIGGGGMGVVYLALDEQLGRAVALKTISPHVVASSSARERFAREVRAVAQLQHPGLVPIHEWGESAAGSYFTMEYVRGRTLAEIVAALRRSAKHDRDAFLAALCEGAEGADTAGARAAFAKSSFTQCAAQIARDAALALDHAHASGIVHRDVKPSNIIVGWDGRVRVLDFGLAQIGSEHGLTLTGDVLGTAPYMSPEQVERSDRELDARTDVYSLGATLYELLSLRPPFDGRTQQQVLSQIPFRDPTPLRKLSPHVARDLETICATALEKNPSRRYASARELADDLERFLESRPIHARPVGNWARAWRIARRHPGSAAALVLGVLLLVGAPIGLAVANQRIRAERDNARYQETLALESVESLEQVLDYLIDFISMSDIEEHGPDLTMHDALALASKKLLEDSSEMQPRARARVMTSIGSIYWMLNDYERADTLLTRALAIQLEALGEEHRETAATRNFLGNLRRSLEDRVGAENEYRRALATFTKLSGKSSDDAVMAQNNLVQLMARGSKLAEAEALCRELIESIRSRATPDTEALCLAYSSLGGIQSGRGNLDAAQATFELALEASRSIGDPAARQAGLYEHLGDLAARRNDAEGAITHYRRSSALYAEAYGARHPFAAVPLVSTGEALRHSGKLEEAETTLREALAMLVESSGAEHPDTVWAQWMLGRTLSEKLELDEAERLLRAVQSYAAVRPGNAAFLKLDLGICLARGEQHAAAIELLEAALEPLRNARPATASQFEECERWLESSRRAIGPGDEAPVGEQASAPR